MQSDFKELKDQLGLGFKQKARPAEAAQVSTPSKAEAYLQDAILMYGPKVMKVISDNQGSATVFKVVDTLHESVDTLEPVVRMLRENGFVELVKQDLKGDHELRLTERGRKVAG